MEQRHTNNKGNDKNATQTNLEGNKGIVYNSYISDEWLDSEIESDAISPMRKIALEELRKYRQAERHEKVLPIPCTVGFEDWTVKEWFQKINEELDELKNSVLSFGVDLICPANKVSDIAHEDNIAEEAIDTITVITSFLEAIGIDEKMRQEAQIQVNRKNKERGRIA